MSADGEAALSLSAMAAECARRHVVRPPSARSRRLGRRVQYLHRVLDRALSRLPQRTGVTSDRAIEWLLDNAHLLAEASEQLRTSLPSGFLRALPELQSTRLQGEPRTYAIALELVRENGGRFDPDRTRTFLMSYQRVTPLRTAELWALPLMLRLVLLERLTASAAALAGLTPSEARAARRLWLVQPAPLPPAAVGPYVEGLRALAAHDWQTFFEEVSLVHGVLRADPASVYDRMDFATRDAYRKAVEDMARWGDADEEAVARAALEAARAAGMLREQHVGFWLTDTGRHRLEAQLQIVPPARVRVQRWCRDYAGWLYFGSIAVLTALLAAVLLIPLLPAPAPVLIALALLVGTVPALSLAIELVNWGATRIVRPRVLPKLSLQEGVPADAAAAIVVPVIVASARDVAELLARLELNYYGNAEPGLVYCVLTDFADAPARVMPDDASLLDLLDRGVRSLNERLSPTSPLFFLLHRDRTWNEHEQRWMGRERKRGKLEEFNRLVLGRTTELVVRVGDSTRLRDLPFAIPLDADTLLPQGAACRLIGALAHPLNRAVFGADDRVIAGYTVLQPRVEILPTATARSTFARVFEGDRSIDLYTHAVSDVYQDVFGVGSFAGKGIYHIADFARSLADAVPENALLSHDLFEGLHGRAGYVSDVVVYEDYPAHVLGYMRRLHRWVRGDWQLLPWLLPWVPAAAGKRRNRLGALARWKIFDNLRRSVLAIAVIFMLIAGWTVLPGPAWWWTGAVLGLFSAPVVLSAVGAARPRGAAHRHLIRLQPPPTLTLGGMRWLLALTLLPYRAWTEADAIARTLVRVFITRRHRLQWTTDAHVRERVRAVGGRAVMMVQLAPAVAIGLGACALVTTIRPAALPVAVPLLLAWIASPIIAYRISISRVAQPPHVGTPELQRLQLLARKTWAFFETFVGPEDQWLPPDHFQEDPRGTTARRTSPTNIGLMALASVAAYDLGYVTLHGLSSRLANTFRSLQQLERYRGHLLNWYETHTLAPLEPRYVSTVDSGNLAGALLAVAAACRDAPSATLPRVALSGLRDTLDALAAVTRQLAAGEDERSAEVDAVLAPLYAALPPAAADARTWSASVVALACDALPHTEAALLRLLETHAHDVTPRALATLRAWFRLARQHIEAARAELDELVPWLSWSHAAAEGEPGHTRPPTAFPRSEQIPSSVALRDLPAACQLVERLLEQLATATSAEPALAPTWIADARARVRAAARNAQQLLAEFAALAERAERLAGEMDFTFLYDHRRHLFHVGYDIGSGRLDTSYYDLLASEARLASLIAIAKGDVPARHWLHLARPFRRAAGVPVLLSWGGSMFEYLMPGLLTRTPRNSLLEMAARSAVQLQQAFGERYGVPWGVSESAYCELDAHATYQYRAFGVPHLALRRDPAERVVVAPYACALAVELAPAAVAVNIERLATLGAVGAYGLFEAIDFGQPAGPRLQEPRIVRSYMAHHQGMVLVALDNLMHDGAMRTRFHADRRIAAVELLLHEHVPGHADAEPQFSAPGRPTPAMAASPRVPVRVIDPEAAQLQVQVLSNGAFSTLVTARGAGGIRWQGKAVTAWSADPACDRHGIWVYLRDLESGALWSVTDAPTYTSEQQQHIRFGLDAVEFRRREHDIHCRVAIAVADNAPVDVRRVTLTNESAVRRRLQVTSYGEVALASVSEYRRHPAFAKLFVHASFLEVQSALLLHRRTATPDEPTIWLAHAALAQDARLLGYETDRAAFLGRGRTARAPRYFDGAEPARHGTTGATLDPIFSLSYEITLLPGQQTEIDFITAVGAARAEALANLDAYRTPGRIQWAFDRARSRCERELLELQLPDADAEHLAELLSAVIYPYGDGTPRLAAAPAIAAADPSLRGALWSLGISGDLPLIVLRAAAVPTARPLAEALIRMHAFWRRAGVRIDLLVIDEAAGGYGEPLRDYLHQALARIRALHWLHQPGGIFHVPAGRLIAAQRAAVEAAASLLIDAERGSLAAQLAPRPRWPPLPPFVPVASAPLETRATPGIARATDLLFDNGLGGFTADGSEYVIFLEPGHMTPAPWSNVVANPVLGFVATEAGLGFTWSGNSGEHRLTTWHNDPVTDPPGEALYLRDEETAAVWSPTPLPTPADTAYEIRHGAGYTLYRHASHGLEQHVLTSVAPDRAVRIVRVQLTNLWQRQRRLTATYYAEWVLGPHPRLMAQHIVTQFDPELHAILARQRFTDEFAGHVAFLAASERAHGATADRLEFLGVPGDPAEPAALQRIGLAGTFGAGLDPCAVLQVHVDLAPGETRTVYFLLGDGTDAADARALIERFREPATAEAALASTRAAWNERLGTLQIRTPDPALDLLVNRWLPYQTLSCRLWGRSGFYQSSGAFGFRDQLQDVSSLLLIAPEVARAHILDAASRQFSDGDVLHWWHPPLGAGVRTRCSDDLLWLPFIVARYVESTGDESVLDEIVPFLTGNPLAAGATDHYDRYAVSGEAASLLEHCLRAVARASTHGPHGLPLIGSGDWNDGMNHVGVGGTGESIWLGWFLIATLHRLAPLLERRGALEIAEQLRARAATYAAAIELHGWDGAWYRRAFFDDGTPLGAADNTECRIDSLAQSWAVLSDAARRERACLAMRAVQEQLVRAADRLVLLLTPPFDRALPSPGYIRAYPPGIRENGGQYTHAAVWVAWAFAQLGDGDAAGRLLHLLNPIEHAATAADCARYRVEPYVVAGDIYGAEAQRGRGGWTWYTGSAAWLYRLAVEAILGVRREHGRTTVEPCIPRHWKSYDVVLRTGTTTLRIHVHNPDGVSRGVRALELDGKSLSPATLPVLADGRVHAVTVRLGAPFHDDNAAPRIGGAVAQHGRASHA